MNAYTVARSGAALTLIGIALAAAGLFAIAWRLPAAEKWDALRSSTGMVAAWFSCAAASLVIATILQGLDDFRAAALVGGRNGGIVSNGLMLATVAALAWFDAVSVERLLLLHCLAAAVGTFLGAAIVKMRIRTLPQSPGNEPVLSDGAELTQAWFFRESLPNLFNQLIALAITEFDVLWVGVFADEAAIADYGVARRLTLFVTAPLLLASVALAPFVAELHSQGQRARLERMLRGTATLLAAPSLLGLVGLLLAPETIIRWTFGDAYVAAGAAMQILSVGCIVFVLSGSNGLTMTMTGRQRELLVCSILSFVLYLLTLAILLRAGWGAEGAAWAFTLQMVLQNTAMTLLVKRLVGVWTIPFTSIATIRQELGMMINRLAPGRKQ
ncbi:MAG: polysaccharide biosynthesis C-terminal domain-containing protein [Pirellulales bacterium]|nr:polysaccharide biosynthesis C-terminal domain-containing protein [Pirellulales bacterium]